jgi:sn-glycerol 3-phosphate transport system substrate-binding protein
MAGGLNQGRLIRSRVEETAGNDSVVRRVQALLRLAAGIVAIGLASAAQATTEIHWWHAMSGQLGKHLEKLAADFNASQSEYRIVPAYKGNYTETVTASIFASTRSPLPP